MWVICKYKRNSFNFLKSNIKKKFSSQLKIYNPTIKYEKISKGKKVIIEENILFLLAHFTKWQEQIAHG